MATEKILLVDNSPGFRDSVRDFLEHHGYRVITASDPVSAKAMMESELPLLAVIDVRLVDDTDDKDVSGLTLAKQTDPSIPKIILTGFPTYQAVREALGPSLDGLSAAVGFVAKDEGLRKLLAAIRLAGVRLNSRFEANLLKGLKVRALVALSNRMDEIGATESARRIQESADSTLRELVKSRDRENKSALQRRLIGMIGITTVFWLIAAAFVAILFDAVKPTLLSLAAGSVAGAIAVLFFRRENEARRRVCELDEELREVESQRGLIDDILELRSPSRQRPHMLEEKGHDAD